MAGVFTSLLQVSCPTMENNNLLVGRLRSSAEVLAIRIRACYAPENTK
jgi:hypothetical protein